MSISADRLVAPDLRAALGLMPNFDGLSGETLASVREMLAVPVDMVDAQDVSATWIDLPGPDGAPGLRAILYRPTATDGPGRRPALLNIHGGGFVAGDAVRDDAAIRALVRGFGCFALSVNYRLAPETPFPGPTEDCYAALMWLTGEADKLGIDPERIAVRGVSAGGGLAVGMALMARDRAGPAIRHLLLIYPMLDDRTQGSANVGQHVWTMNANRYGWSAFLGPRRGDPPAYAVPARADDLAGLPPVFLGVGSIDLFIEEDLAFAGRLAAAGVAVDAAVYAGAYHGFNLVAGSATAARFEHDFTRALSIAFAPSEETVT